MPRRLFFPDNIDPVTFAAIIERLPLDRVLWNVVTKSGGTAETCAQFLVVAEELDKRLGPERAKKHIVCTTDPEKGALRAIAREREATRRSTFRRTSAVGSACCRRWACCRLRSPAST